MFDELVMSLRDLELLPGDWILCFEVDFVFEVLGHPEVVLVNAKSIMVFAQDIKVPFLEFFGT